MTTTTGGPCRFCGAELTTTFVDLGKSPLCETYLTPEQLQDGEMFYPLHTYVCGECFLVQLQEFVPREEIFREYAYFSSYSEAWLEHCKLYVEQMVDELSMGPDSLVLELASNDGYLLQYFVEREIPVLGVEPALNIAAVANERGIPTRPEFFGRDYAATLAEEGVQADLVLGNNVLAQVPDLNDFVGGIPLVLAPDGRLTIEFPHLMRQIEENQFDQIYHEHYSYFSLLSAARILEAHGLTIFDVEELWTHGGSIRIHAGHTGNTPPATERLEALREEEGKRGTATLSYYQDFAMRVERLRRDILTFLIDAKNDGKRVVGYGAPGKGNTLLNYCGIRSDLIEFTADRNPYKHGRFTPGTHIPIHDPELLEREQVDYVFILPWNLTDEIVKQLSHLTANGTQFVRPVPELTVLES